MDPRRLIMAAAVLAALAGALWWSNKHEDDPSKKSDSDAPPKIVEIPQDQITRIEIRRASADPVILERGANWTIKSPRELSADQDAVSSIVSTLSVLNSDRMIDEKVADPGAYGLKTPILTVIVSRKDGKSHTLRIGDDTPAGSAAYAMLDGDPRLYTVASFTRTSLEKTAEDLRDKRLLLVDGDKITSVAVTAKGASIEFGKNAANHWTILKPRAIRADNFAVEELVRKLKEAKMEVTNDTEERTSWPGKFASAVLVGTAKVTDQKGTHQLEVRKTADGVVFVKSSSLEGVYKSTADLGEALGKGLDDFRNRKLFDFGFNEPQHVEVKYENTTFVFTKSAAEWKKDGKPVDAGNVQQVIDKLRDLTATKFADAAPGAPIAEFTVGSEKVSVTRQGEAYYARRAGEPEVFVLDAAAVTGIKDLAASAKAPEPPKTEKK